jgi:hypothetical protein
VDDNIIPNQPKFAHVSEAYVALRNPEGLSAALMDKNININNYLKEIILFPKNRKYNS